MTISAKVIADSVSYDGVRITTFVLEYPRFIHAEFMTHRMLSRNAASSRAIPIKKQIELIEENLAAPIHWGKHQPGMQASEELQGARRKAAKKAWNFAGRMACRVARFFVRIGAHKQFANRILEPWAHIKVVVTATEFDNFFWLRRHKDAQPEIRELADRMWEAMNEQLPHDLYHGEWHMPFLEQGYWRPGMDISLEDALKISASCCAQVSYRTLDDSLEKAEKIYDQLVSMVPVHASPFEHQATPHHLRLTSAADGTIGLPAGVTHMAPSKDMHLELWSGNFRGWTQYRQLIDGHVCNDLSNPPSLWVT